MPEVAPVMPLMESEWPTTTQLPGALHCSEATAKLAAMLDWLHDAPPSVVTNAKPVVDGFAGSEATAVQSLVPVHERLTSPKVGSSPNGPGRAAQLAPPSEVVSTTALPDVSTPSCAQASVDQHEITEPLVIRSPSAAVFQLAPASWVTSMESNDPAV